MANSLVRFGFEPFREIERIRSEMNRLFGESLSRYPGNGWADSGSPKVDIYATNEDLLLVVELPGLNQEALEITTNQDVLTFSGEFKLPELPENAEILRQERWYGRFSRSFQMPFPIDADHAEATIKDGLLVVRVPKAKEAKTRTVPINTH